MKNKKKNVVIFSLFVLVVLSFLTGNYIFRMKTKDMPTDNSNNNQNEEILDNVSYKNVFLKSNKKNDNNIYKFENLLNYNINHVLLGKITYSVEDNNIYGQVNGYKKLLLFDNDKDILSIRVSCSYDECCNLYYLTDENRVYSINLESFLNDGYKGKASINLESQLDATRTTKIDVIQTYENEHICGNEDLLYKDLENNTWKYIFNEEKRIFERKEFSESNNDVKYIKNNNSSGVYVVYESEFELPEDSKFISDENDKGLIAVNAFYGYFDKSNVKDTKFFVINNDDKIYVSSNNNLNNDHKLKLYNKKTVKNITDISDNDEYKVRIDYMDGSSEEIYTPYSYNEEYKF